MKVFILLLGAGVIGGGHYYLRPPVADGTSGATSTSPKLEAGADQSGDFLVEADISDHGFTSKAGENHVKYRVAGEFTGNFRVFGVSPNETANSPINHVSAFLKLARLEEARSALEKEGCERRVAEEAKTVAVVVVDNEVAEQLRNFAPGGGELRLSGKILEIESHKFAGQEYKPAGGGVSVEKIYLLRGVEKATLESAGVALERGEGVTPTLVTKSSQEADYSWNFSAGAKLKPEKKIDARPSCKKTRVIRVIRRCPR